MRVPASLRPNRRNRYFSEVVSTPAPVGGWNARDSLANMGATDAVILDNIFPRTSDVIVRNGSETFASDMPSPVETIMVYDAATSIKLFAASGSEIYEATGGGQLDPILTNLLIHSGELNASTGWSFLNTTVTADLTNNPFGAATADRIISSASNGEHYIQQAVTTTVASTQNLSIYAKVSTGSRNLLVRAISATTSSRRAGLVFDASAGTILSNFEAGGADVLNTSVSNIGSGWYRVAMSYVLGGTDAIEHVQYGLMDTTVTSFLGTGLGIYAYGGQLTRYNRKTVYIDTTTSASQNSGDVVVTSVSSARFQYVNFGTPGGRFLIAVNGVNSPKTYDGTNWFDTTVTGSATLSGLQNDWITVMAHQRRLFFGQENTARFWYMQNVESISGTVASFDLGPIFSKGGELQAMGTWSLDGGAGLDDVAVFVSSNGEVAVYRGTDPGSASNWSLVGVFHVGRPIGRRCITKYGGDLAIITEDGFYPLSRALITAGTSPRVAISDKISGAVTDATRAYATNFGWEALLYPNGPMMLFNIPTTENEEAMQFVYNPNTQAWCRFLNWNANCFAVAREDLYFGANGTIEQADTGNKDNGDFIEWDVEPAFNYMQKRGAQKRFVMVRPNWLTKADLNKSGIINVDFGNEEPQNVPSLAQTTEPLWDVTSWDVSPWGQGYHTNLGWESVAGVGYCGTYRQKGNEGGAKSALIAIDYMFETGGYL